MIRHRLEHHLWSVVHEESVMQKKFLIALSGGADSVALTCLFANIIPVQQLMLFHFHHGIGEKQQDRDNALQFVQALANKLQLPMLDSRWLGDELRSEEELRQARYQALYKCLSDYEFDYIVTGHQAEDLLETRLMRMIRGTGPQGLRAMKVLDNKIFRPLLQVQRHEIMTYLQDKEQSYIQDSSNFESHYFRNWLRHEWLPLLEAKKPGALQSLGRSIESLVSSIEMLPKNNDTNGIPRSEYLSLSRIEQRRRLAAYLLAMGVRDFSQAQLEEVQKRLDSSQKVLTFRVAGCNWLINAERIQVELST